jgi:hypothetical protein
MSPRSTGVTCAPCSQENQATASLAPMWGVGQHLALAARWRPPDPNREQELMWGEADAHLDKVQPRRWTLGTHTLHEGPPGCVDVVQAQHGGPHEAGTLCPLVVEHTEQGLDTQGEVLGLGSRGGWGAVRALPERGPPTQLPQHRPPLSQGLRGSIAASQ